MSGGVAAKGRVGRPARVNRELIARTAQEIGLADLTMKAVAARLEVSVTTLYYHVHDRNELTRLVAEYSAASLRVPQDVDQHWAEWLAEWAEYARSAFVDQPGLLEQFVNGTLGLDRMLPHIDAVIAVMEKHGFSPDDALAAYMLVSAVAIGVAVSEVRTGNADRQGRTFEAEYLAAAGADTFAHIGKLAAAGIRVTPFREQIATVLVGIAVRRREDPDAVLAAFRDPIGFLHP